MIWSHGQAVHQIAASYVMSVPFGSPQVAPFGLPAVGGKPVVAAFDGGRITSDGGVLLLAPVERQLGIADTLAQLIADPRNPAYVTHSIGDILRASTLYIDDTSVVAHGKQQLALFHAHYDRRCFLPIHVYDAPISRPVVVLFRPR